MNVVEVEYERAANHGPLPLELQQLLVCLVLRRHTGVEASHVEDWRAVDDTISDAEFDSLVDRLRQHFPPNAIRRFGRFSYRLDLPTEDVDFWLLTEYAESSSISLDPDLVNFLLRAEWNAAALADGYSGEIHHSGTVKRLQAALLHRISDLPLSDAVRHQDVLLTALDSPVGLDSETLVLFGARLLAIEGRRREALAIISRAGRRLADAGLEPSAKLRSFEQDLLNGEDVEQDEVAPRRSSQLNRDQQDRARTALEPVTGAIEAALHSDGSLSVEDENFVAAQLATIRSQAQLEQDGDPAIIERAVANIVRRLLRRMYWGDRARSTLQRLGAEPPELVDRISESINAALDQIVLVGIPDPEADAQLLLGSSEEAERSRSLLESLRGTPFGSEFEKKLGASAAIGVSGIAAYLAVRIGPGFESAALRLVESWPGIVDAFTSGVRLPRYGPVRRSRPE